MIEIIPKPAAKLPLWQNILFYFSIALLIAAISSIFIFNNFVKKSSANLQNLEITLAKGRIPSEVALEKEILSYQAKIEDIAYLLNLRQSNLKLFELLEDTCHPKVQFLNFNLNLKEHQVSVQGSTESFKTLGQQIIIFKKNPLIKEVSLSGISMKKEGVITFNVGLLFNTQIFK